MKMLDLHSIHHCGLIRACDFRAFAFNNGLKWSSVLVNISRWQKQGVLERVTRGAYLLRDVEVDAAVIACRVVPDSYLSLEWAMVYHGMLLDRMYTVDLVCPRRVQSFHVRNVEIRLTKIPPRLCCGWAVEESSRGPIRVATAEKALVDRLYLDTTALPDCSYFQDMGLQPDALNLDRFVRLAELSPKVQRYSRILREYCRE